jgi:hypothetical protein
MAIMPTRSFPPGATSVDVCPNAASDNPANIVTINRRSRAVGSLFRKEQGAQLYQSMIRIA